MTNTSDSSDTKFDALNLIHVKIKVRSQKWGAMTVANKLSK